MTDAILKNTIADNADNTTAAAIQASFAFLNTNLASVNAGLQSLAAANGDILRALKTGQSNLRGCGCCGCCCCGGGNAAVSSRDTVYAVFTGSDYANGKTTLKLASYNHPLASQAEADAVEVIVFLGGERSRGQVGYNQPFTLDGFAMPGGFDVDFWGVNSYPASFLRKKDGSGWIPLTRMGVVHMEWMNVLYVSSESLPPEDVYGKYQLCCGLFEHNCRGKTFYAQITVGDYWPEDKKQRPAVFYLRKDTISYDKFPNNTTWYIDTADDDGNYVELPISRGYNSGNSTWGELIEKFGDKTFGIQVSGDGYSGNMAGIAFAME